MAEEAVQEGGEAAEAAETPNESQEGGKFSGRSFGGDGKKNDDDKGADGEASETVDRPENVPDKFWDADKGEMKSTEMAKAYADLEKAHGKLKREKSIGGEVPESADDYFGEGLELPETVDRLDVLPDDPGLKVWGSIAHKYGIGKELAVNIAKDMFSEMNQFAEAPVDPEQELASLGDNASAITEGVEVWLDGLDKAGQLSDDDADIAMQLSQTAKGVRFLRAMREATGERPIPMMPSTGKSSMSPTQFDEEYKQAVKDKDYGKREKLDAMRDAVFGGARHNAGFSSDKKLTRRER